MGLKGVTSGWELRPSTMPLVMIFVPLAEAGVPVRPPSTGGTSNRVVDHGITQEPQLTSDPSRHPPGLVRVLGSQRYGTGEPVNRTSPRDRL